ncbi:MAG: tRNA pseudouridine(55) synthase TruB, partial [Cyanobacteriota bacterium]|jgi:tRNA pseudouridine55 synthase
VPLDQLQQQPPPPLQDPLPALGHLPRQQLDPGELAGWRCGRPLQAQTLYREEQAVAILSPEGVLAGIAHADAAEQLLPRLVFDASG